MTADLARGMWDRLPDAVVAVTAEGRVLFWNQAAESLFGYSSAEAMGRTLADLIIPADRLAEERRIREAVPSCGLTLYESVRHRKDGSLLDVSISTKAVHDDAGKLEFILHTKRDVTNLKVQRDTHLVETRFRGLLEAAPDAMVIVSRTGRIALVNAQTETLFGYRREELLGQLVEVLVPERYRHSHAGYRGDFFHQPRARSMRNDIDLYGLRRDGSEFPVEISLSPLITEDGVFVSSAIRDVTERKRHEQALQDANRLKSEFLANMSHELRTPLNAIIGFSEFLIDGSPGIINDKQQEYLNDILGCGRHLLRLINDILDLSKVEAGKIELFPETFSVRAAVEEVCAVAAALANDKGITIHRQVNTHDDRVTLDRHRLIQVLYNLLSNAVKFTDHGGEVFIGAEIRDDGILRVWVRDTGIGISPQDLGSLFVEFRQLDSGTARRYGGTGLGLALTKRIVEAQRGTVAVESALGRGSTFTVTLPFARTVSGAMIVETQRS